MLKTTEIYTLKGEFYGMWIIYQFKNVYEKNKFSLGILYFYVLNLADLTWWILQNLTGNWAEDPP